MYNGDVYDLTKNTSTGYSAVPLRGVKQGFPPSPPLFSLFINDVDDDFGSGLVGVGMLESLTDWGGFLSAYQKIRLWLTEQVA